MISTGQKRLGATGVSLTKQIILDGHSRRWRSKCLRTRFNNRAISHLADESAAVSPVIPSV